MTYLSDIKMGYEMGILNEPKAKINIYGLVMNIQPGNLQKDRFGFKQPRNR